MDGQGQAHCTPNGAGLSVLACFDSPLGHHPHAEHCCRELARLTGLSIPTVERQLALLVSHGYIEKISDRSYLLAPRMFGDREIIVTSTRHSRTTSNRGDLSDDHGATSAS